MITSLFALCVVLTTASAFTYTAYRNTTCAGSDNVDQQYIFQNGVCVTFGEQGVYQGVTLSMRGTCAGSIATLGERNDAVCAHHSLCTCGSDTWLAADCSGELLGHAVYPADTCITNETPRSYTVQNSGGAHLPISCQFSQLSCGGESSCPGGQYPNTISKTCTTCPEGTYAPPGERSTRSDSLRLKLRIGSPCNRLWAVLLNTVVPSLRSGCAVLPLALCSRAVGRLGFLQRLRRGRVQLSTWYRAGNSSRR